MAVDVTPYGLSLDRGSIPNGKVVGFSYKWLSGIALAFVAGIALGSRWVGIICEQNSSGKMACNTTVHSVQLEFGLLFFSLHFSFGFAHGKRDDAYIADLPKTIEELAAQIQQAQAGPLLSAGIATDPLSPPYPGYPPDFGGGSLRQDN